MQIPINHLDKYGLIGLLSQTLDKRKQVAIFAASGIGIFTVVFTSLIIYPAYQKNLEQTELLYRFQDNFVPGLSIFNKPEIFADTSERHILYLTLDNFTSVNNQFHFTNNTQFGFCYNSDNPEFPIGYYENPAIVRIVASEPAVVSFCDSNWGIPWSQISGTTAKMYYIQLRPEMLAEIPDGADYDNRIKGVNFSLNTRTVDMPSVQMELEPVYRNETVNVENMTMNIAGAKITKATVVAERIYLYVIANSDAIEGLHLFDIRTEPTQNSTYQGFGLPIWVKIVR